MDKNRSAEDMLREIDELLKSAQDSKKPLSPDVDKSLILKEIELLKEGLSYFGEMQNKGIQQAGIDVQHVQQQILESSDDSPEKQILLKSVELEKEAQLAHEAYKQASVLLKKKKKELSSGEKTSQKEMRERRKMFKTLGGDNKWIPL